jgi:hypothetical protein
MEKSQIRDKHPGSATLLQRYHIFLNIVTNLAERVQRGSGSGSGSGEHPAIFEGAAG